VTLTIQALHFHAIDFGHEDSTIYLGIARVCASFFIGVGLFRLHRAGVFANAPKVSGFVLAVVLLASFFPGSFHGGGIFDMACVLVLFPIIIIICGISDTVPARWMPAVRVVGAFILPCLCAS
jgi:hypothetical protein